MSNPIRSIMGVSPEERNMRANRRSLVYAPNTTRMWRHCAQQHRNPHRSHRHSIRRILLLLTATACSSPDFSGPASVDPAQLAWTLSLNAHAITLSTDTSNHGQYSTFQLTATPRTMTGALLTDASAPTFESRDSSVRVSATGLLTARSAQTGVPVIASTVYHGVRISDTAMVNVTTVVAPPSFGRLQLRVLPSDSARIAAPNVIGNAFYYPQTKTLQVVVEDAAGAPIAQSLVAMRTSNPLQATVPAMVATPTVDVSIPQLSSRVGEPVTVYASATIYGVTHEDSLQLSVTQQLFFQFALGKSTPPGRQTPVYTFYPRDMRDAVIAKGGWVWWSNSTSNADSLDIVFDDPTAASPDEVGLGGFFNTGGGNIPAFAGYDPATESFLVGTRSRQFLRVGQFHFHSERTGVSGTITVQ